MLVDKSTVSPLQQGGAFSRFRARDRAYICLSIYLSKYLNRVNPTVSPLQQGGAFSRFQARGRACICLSIYLSI